MSIKKFLSSLNIEIVVLTSVESSSEGNFWQKREFTLLSVGLIYCSQNLPPDCTVFMQFWWICKFLPSNALRNWSGKTSIFIAFKYNFVRINFDNTLTSLLNNLITKITTKNPSMSFYSYFKNLSFGVSSTSDTLLIKEL